MVRSKNITVNEPAIKQVEAKNRYTLSVNIKRFTTDQSGTVLDDAAIPLALKKPFPFHMFGEFDRNGGYSIADGLLSRVNNTILFSVYTWGLNSPIFFFNPLATINNEFTKGDTVFVYVDDIVSPNYFIFVIIQAQQSAYGSLVGQLNTTQLDRNNWGTFKLYNVDYSWIHENQLDQSVFIIRSRFDASFTADQLQPRAYYSTMYKQGVRKLILPVDAIANQFYGMSSFIAYENPLLNLMFTVYA